MVQRRFQPSRSTRAATLAGTALLFTILSSGAALSLVGCKDQAKESAAHAAQDVAELAALVDKDVAEVRNGLPEGAERLAPLLAGGADPAQDVAGVRRSLLRMRHAVPALEIAKSTFFAVADPNGVAIRNDLEEDVMAGQNLFRIFPELAHARQGFVETTGAFPHAATKSGPDKDWVAGVPIRRADGSTGALLVTGWTYRYFARHLEASLRDRLAERAKASGDEGRLPVFYVAVFDASGVYSAPLTPAIDEKALADQGLVAKTAGGSCRGALQITDRDFGFAAQRTPSLGPDVGIVVLRSEL